MCKVTCCFKSDPLPNPVGCEKRFPQKDFTEFLSSSLVHPSMSLHHHHHQVHAISLQRFYSSSVKWSCRAYVMQLKFSYHWKHKIFNPLGFSHVHSRRWSLSFIVLSLLGCMKHKVLSQGQEIESPCNLAANTLALKHAYKGMWLLSWRFSSFKTVNRSK